MGLVAWGVILLIAGGGGYIFTGSVLSDPMANNGFALALDSNLANTVGMYRMLNNFAMIIGLVGAVLLVAGLLRRSSGAPITATAVGGTGPVFGASGRPTETAHRFCVKCGAQNAPDDSFCAACGAQQPRL